MATKDVYKEFMLKSTLMISIFDKHKILITIHNPNNNFLIKPIEEQIGKSVDEIIDSPELAKVINACLDRTIATGETNELEHRLYVGDLLLYYRFTSVLLDDGTVALSSSDISTRKKEEVNKQMDINFLYQILDKIPVAIILKDCKTKQYIFWNKESELYSKISSQEALGKVDAELFPENVCRQFEQSDNLLLDNRKPQQSKQVLNINNELIYTIVNKHIVTINQKDYILGVRWNVTELEKEKNKSQLIFDNVDVGFIFLSSDYKVQWENVNRIFNTPGMLAYTVGNTCYHGSRGKDKPCEGCIMEQALSSGKTQYRTIKTANEHDMAITAIPVYEAGQNVGVVLKLEDITNKLKQENELKEAKEKAEQSDRLKSLFLANMSHEIRTPLNAIVGFSDLLINCEEQIDREEFGAIIANNSQLLLNLINEILDLSKIEAGLFTFHKDYFDVHELCTELDSVFGMQVKESIKLKYIESPRKVKAYLDKSRFRQILNNYLSNAVKYTLAGTIRFGYKVENNGIRLFVKDTGVGISEENKKMVFQRFKKFDDFAQGTGLGLSICKALVELQGGEVGFESTLHEGSTFWAWIPCQMEELKPIELTDINEKPMFEATNGKLNILVAEDIDSNYLLVRTILKDYNLSRALNGVEAVEFCKVHNFDIVFMDINMPKMNGLEATRTIREFNKKVPIIALTANAFDSDKLDAKEAGCDDFIAKPISKAHLLDAINKWGKKA